MGERVSPTTTNLINDADAAAAADLLSGLSRPQRASALERIVLEALQLVVARGGDRLSLDTTYVDAGLTRPGAQRVKEYLESTLGLHIDIGGIVNQRSVRDLVTYLKREVLADLFEEPAPAQRGVIRHTALWDTMLTSLYRS